MEELSIEELEELNSHKIEWLELNALPSIIKRDTLFAYFKSESGKYYKMNAFDVLSAYAGLGLSYLPIIEVDMVDNNNIIHTTKGRIDKIARFIK